MTCVFPCQHVMKQAAAAEVAALAAMARTAIPRGGMMPGSGITPRAAAAATTMLGVNGLSPVSKLEHMPGLQNAL